MGARRVVLGLAVAVASGCSARAPGSGSGASSTAPGRNEGTGSLALGLSVAGGGSQRTIESVHWVVTNSSNGFAESGDLNVSDADTIQLNLTALPVGSGYTIQLSATDTSADSCAGSATFTIVPAVTASATVTMTCALLTDATLLPDVQTGSVSVDASVVTVPVAEGPACPGIMSLSVSPATQRIGSASTLAIDVVGPSPSVAWTQTGAGSGTFGDASAAPTTFTCVTAGMVSLTAAVGLPDSGVCSGVAYTTESSTIDCEAQCSTALDCPTSTTACASAVCSSATCGVTDALVGTPCSDSGGTLCNGGGACVKPTFDVVRVGDGFAALGGAASPVFVDQYDLTGALVGSPIVLPTVALGNNQIFTLTGSNVAEGDLTTSADGRSITLAGYAASTGNPVTSATRVIARIDAAGNVDTSTVLAGAFDGGDIRSAASLDGAEFWIAGTASDAAGGIWTLPADTALITLPSAAQPGVAARWLRVAGGQLYGDSNADPPDLFAVGSGTPTSGSPALAALRGLPISGASPYGFAFFDLDPAVPGLDTLYIADDGIGPNGGVQKWTLSTTGDGGASTWTQAWVTTLAGEDGGPPTGFRGLAGYASGATVTLMATTGLEAGEQNSLAVIVDTGTGTPTPTIVATAYTNEVFRGVAVPPHP